MVYWTISAKMMTETYFLPVGRNQQLTEIVNPEHGKGIQSPWHGVSTKNHQ